MAGEQNRIVCKETCTMKLNPEGTVTATYEAGQEYTIPRQHAEALVAAGRAELAKDVKDTKAK
jgi:hypothetical protein